MTLIKFEDGWQDKFAKAGLKDFDDFFAFAHGKIVNKNNKRDVMSFSLDIDGVKKDFFMKRFYTPHYKDTLFTFRNYFKFCSQGFIEWANAGNLLKNGIDSYHPVCFGEKMSGPFEKCSFVVTEQLGGTCLTDLLPEKWNDMDQAKKESLLTAMADLAAKVHNCKLSLPDLYVWHYFVTETADGFELAIIDLHRMKLRAGNSDFARNLGALHYSMIDKYFSEEERQFLIRKYFEIRGINGSSMLKKILNRSDVHKSRRREPVY